MKKTLLMILGLILAGAFFSQAIAADKAWNAAGDATSWSDATNWSPSSVPTSTDDVTVNFKNAAATISVTGGFNAKSLTIGGTETSSVTVQDFISGTVSPAAASSMAVDNRVKGTFRLKGGGTVTVKGQYKSSKGTQPSQPSLVFYIQ